MGAEGFADLLKELKERSGLSYGVLAKRLHMSTSTLHRYVNGSAVPVEFAPVERLGRLCKASPEELVELHRRWIVADAGRGRREGAAPAGGAVPPVAGRPEPEGAVPSAAGRPEPEGAAGDGVPPESGGPEPGAVPTRPAPRDDRPQREQVSEAASEAPLVTDRATGRRRPERRRLVVFAAVGVILALGGTALAVQNASGGSSGDGREASSVGGPSAGTEVTEDGKRKRNPTATATSPGPEPGKEKAGRDGGSDGRRSGDGKTGKAGEGKGRTGKGGSSSSGAPGGGAADLGAASGAVPVTVSTQPHYWYDPCGQPYLVAREPARLSPPPNEQDAPGWVSANGAIPAGRQTVKLTVQGVNDDTVVLESLHVRVVASGAPLKRNSYNMGYVGVGCGGNVPQHSFDVNLDASVPRLTPKSGEAKFPYKVSESDPTTFFVDADVKAHDVSWYLELEWSSGDRRGTVRLDDSGKPFRTSGDRGNSAYGYSLDSKRWVAIRRDANGGVEAVR